VFNTLKVSGIVILGLTAGMALFLALGGGRPRARGARGGNKR
jgi:hypothetical protein